ncbi:TonB-dependent receptor [Janthinobacterium sp.]|uniref:TonB-dependent receptor n=1 Tax=Janthinobacterium sp. TaxID=1871054 RepID=UPI00293D79E8|nr:TonB-dependent receptor [Janthinobacterium sp.]
MFKTSQNHAPRRYAARSLIALAVASAFPLQAARAQEAAPEAAKAQPGQLEVVIVTAQRRSENIKDVPMAISTMKGEKLDVLTAGGQDVRFMSGRTPSLNVESEFGRSFPRFYVRGLGNIDFDLNASQPVGLVFDDVVQENPILKGFPVFDVEQVEVLRGPQGTLFGRNSPAGVVKFESVKPGKKLEGYVSAGFGNYGAVNLEGAYNVPLGEQWAARLSLQSQSRDDRVHNPRPSGTRDLEGYEDKAARLQLSFKPNKDFSALLNLHHREMEGSATLFRANIIKKGTNELVDGFDYGTYPTDGINQQTLTSGGASLHLRWDLDGVTLHAISAYEKAKYASRADVDGGYGAVYAPPSGPGFIPFTAETGDGLPKHRQLSQEVRVESNGKERLQWLGGVYAFDEDITVDSTSYDTLNGSVVNGFAQQHQRSKSWALFGSLNYALSDAWKVRGGLRYTDDKKDFSAYRSIDPRIPSQYVGAIGPLTANPRASNTSWDLSSNYALNPDTNIYARIATGYRAPSIQGRILFGDTISIGNAERNLSYEAGVKQELFDKRARLSATVYQYRVKDMQLTAGSGAVNQNRLVNAAKAIGQGVELEFQAILSDEFRLTLGGSYNDTEITDPNLFVASCGSGCTVTSPAGPTPGTSMINGDPLPRAPKWTGNVTLRYSKPVGEGEFYAYTDWSYRSSYNMFLDVSKEYTAKSLLEGGLRAGYKWADGKYEVAAYGRNITNRVQIVGAINFNNLTGIVNEPRTFGAQFKANF